MPRCANCRSLDAYPTAHVVFCPNCGARTGLDGKVVPKPDDSTVASPPAPVGVTTTRSLGSSRTKP